MGGGSQCIFHTAVGKIKAFEKKKPIFFKPEERNKRTQTIIKDFIQAFSDRLKRNTKSKLYCSRFIFPHLTEEEWWKMWKPVSIIPKQPDEKPQIKLDFPISFRNAIFGGEVLFGGAIFNEEIDCSLAEFIRGADFGYAKFHHRAKFDHARFQEYAAFTNAKFKKDACFDYATFDCTATFLLAEIKYPAYFTRTEFNNYTEFVATRFGADAYFPGAKFVNEVHFTGAIFGELADFRHVAFHNNVYLGKSVYLKIGNFSNTKFYKETDFTKVTARILNFTQSEIYSFVRMREINKLTESAREEIASQIKRYADIKEVELYKSLLQQKIELLNEVPILLLRDLRFWENGHLLLEDFNITRTSLWHTNFCIIRPRIDLVRVDWGEDRVILDDKIFRNKSCKDNMTLDKKEWNLVASPIINTEEKIKVEELERCYRQIRLAYEAKGEYPDAGDFYLHEMKIRKKRFDFFKKWRRIRIPGKTCILKFFHTSYGLISNYGETVGLALFCFIVVLLVGTVALAFTGFESSDKLYKLTSDINLHYSPETIKTLINSFMAITSSTIPGLEVFYKPVTTVGNAIINITRGLGLITLTLLLLAIRRRFRR